MDIAYALRDFGVQFRYLTTTIGVDPTYQSQPFYRDSLDADSMRVNKLFAQAASKEIIVERRSLKGKELQALPPSQRSSTLLRPESAPTPTVRIVPRYRMASSPIPPITHHLCSALVGSLKYRFHAQELVKPHENMVMALVDRRYLYRPASSSVSGLFESVFTRCFNGSPFAPLLPSLVRPRC